MLGAMATDDPTDAPAPDAAPTDAPADAQPDAPASAPASADSKPDRERLFDPTAPLLAWLSAVQEISGAALGQVDDLTRLSQAQWRVVRDAMALMGDLPLSAVEDGMRDLARLREALRAVQLQMALVDDQLEALSQVLAPVHEWSRAWRGLVGETGG
jgi:hypothetical protein